MPDAGQMLSAYVGPHLNPDQVTTLAELLRTEIAGGLPMQVADVGEVICLVTPRYVWRIEPTGDYEMYEEENRV
jgi:hypothetical protein